MAKMKIYEIARSLQSKNKEIKSGDLVKLLNDNGFEVKGANSNIEDDAIAFLLKTFSNTNKPTVPAKKKKRRAKRQNRWLRKRKCRRRGQNSRKK